MEVLLAGVGMLACMALMMVVIPLGVKVVRRVRPGSTGPTSGGEASRAADSNLGDR